MMIQVIGQQTFEEDAGEAREDFWKEVALKKSPGRQTVMKQNKTVDGQTLEVVGSE